MINKSMAGLIGNTPLVELSSSGIFAKLEYFNPTGSIKDRTALSLIQAGEKKGLLKKGGVIIEPTSGNTGISLAWLAGVKGYKAVLVMPQNTSGLKLKILKSLGAKVVFTSIQRGMQEAREKAQLLSRRYGYYMPDQFSHPANPQAHIKTGREIWQDTRGKVDMVVAGIGTGGTITGVARFLKRKSPRIKIVGVEPKSSAALYASKYGKKLTIKPHRIEGIGAGFVPQVLEKELIDEVILVSDEEAEKGREYLIKGESIWGGMSAGAVWQAVSRLRQQKKNHKKRIVFIVADSFLRYLD